MSEMTDRQRLVLMHIYKLVMETGFPPTLRELGDSLGFAGFTGVTCHLKALKKKGQIVHLTTAKGDGKHRSRGVMPAALLEDIKASARVGLKVLSAESKLVARPQAR